MVSQDSHLAIVRRIRYSPPLTFSLNLLRVPLWLPGCSWGIRVHCVALMMLNVTHYPKQIPCAIEESSHNMEIAVLVDERRWKKRKMPSKASQVEIHEPHFLKLGLGLGLGFCRLALSQDAFFRA